MNSIEEIAQEAAPALNISAEELAQVMKEAVAAHPYIPPKEFTGLIKLIAGQTLEEAAAADLQGRVKQPEEAGVFLAAVEDTLKRLTLTCATLRPEVDLQKLSKVLSRALGLRGKTHDKVESLNQSAAFVFNRFKNGELNRFL